MKLPVEREQSHLKVAHCGCQTLAGTRRGVLVKELGQTYLAESDADGEEARTLLPLQVAAATYRISFGPRAGQKVLTLRSAMPR